MGGFNLREDNLLYNIEISYTLKTQDIDDDKLFEKFVSSKNQINLENNQDEDDDWDQFKKIVQQIFGKQLS